ncbi:MAG TPA: ferrochelatase [Candidatus Micrarchaeia archaeon]|nr:ferrochelatase [Candidatus Micrarchaeia archaeon]
MSAPHDATAVLLMAYGTPSGPEAVEPYLRHMRGGRSPGDALVADLRRRYAAIGGSPLHAITMAQGEGLEAELNRRGRGPFRVHVGMKHAPPFIEEAAAAIRAGGAARAVALVLAPHYSELSIGEYLARARGALAQPPPGPRLVGVEHWHLEPGFVAWLAQRVTSALDRLTEAERAASLVVFTAHSLPARIRATEDPYPDALPATAAAVAGRLGLPRWTTAWQSAARTGEPWLGPDLETVVAGAAADGTRAVVVCPAGFTADHLEVLYDIDIELRRQAADLGVRLERTDAPNADPVFLSTLADIVLGAAAGLGAPG